MNKSPVICLHGFPGLPSFWDSFAQQLPIDRDVYSLPMPWLLGSAAGIDGFGAVLKCIAALIKQASVSQAHYVGHDLGAVALHWLAQTEFRSKIKSMTIISAPHPFAYLRFLGTPDAGPRISYIDRILESTCDERLQRELGDGVSLDDRALARELNAAMGATDFAAMRMLYTQIKQTRMLVEAQFDMQEDMKVALVYTQNDQFFPASVMEESALYFGASETTLILDGDSHYPHLTQTEKVANFSERFWNAVEP